MKEREISDILKMAYEGIGNTEFSKSGHKYVLTGGPCCGKTTLVERLEKEGYEIVPEMARLIIDDQLRSGGDALPWENRKKFQDYVIYGQAIMEQSLSEGDPVILDRAIPDNLAYFINDGTSVSEDYYKMFNSFCPYGCVFIPDRLSMKNDYARRESDEEAERLHTIISSTYTDLGNPVVRVPIFDTIDDRVNYVIGKIGENEKKTEKAAKYLASGHVGIYSDPGMIEDLIKRRRQ